MTSIRAAATLIASIILVGSSTASAQYRVCNRHQITFTPSHIYWGHWLRRSTQGTPGVAGDSADWTPSRIDAYTEAGSALYRLDISSPEFVTIDPTGTTSEGFSGWDSEEVMHVQRSDISVGKCMMYNQWPFDTISHVDIRIDGPTRLTTGYWRRNRPLAWQGSCATMTNAETGTVLHEVGHAWGYSHFYDWISMLNQSQIDVYGCAVSSRPQAASMAVFPDAYLTTCTDMGHDLPPGVNVAITPVFHPVGCSLGTTSCSTIPGPGRGSPTRISSSATFFWDYVQYTTMSTLDTITANVGVRMVLSTDNFVDEGDVEIFSGLLSPAQRTAGATLRSQTNVTFNPQIAMPLENQTYCVLIQLDASRRVAETIEGDKRTDTAFCYMRGST